MRDFTDFDADLWGQLELRLVQETKETLSAAEELAEAGATQAELIRLLAGVHLRRAIATALLKKGRRIYRAVQWPERPTLLGHIRRKPAALVQDVGRVNSVGESVFYGSTTGPAVCLYECHAEVGQTFVVGTWELSEDLKVAPFGFVDRKVMAIRANSERYPQWMGPKSKREVDRMVASWHSEIFTAENSPAAYALTRALSTAVLSLRREFSGVLYPSVAGAKFGENLALPADVSDRSLKFVECKFVRVTELWVASSGEPFVRIDNVDHCQAVGAGGELLWASDHIFPFSPRSPIVHSGTRSR